LSAAVSRRLTALPLLAAALAGCGGDDKPVDLPDGPKTTSDAHRYKGRTSQGQPITIEAGRRVLASVKVPMRCKDDSSTEATVRTEPKRPELQADGSFYYSETGRTTFRGYGPGRYRVALAGELKGREGSGTLSFRISFKSTSCRGNATWETKLT
jgi:predicted small lipoprotein YifL